MMKVNEHADNHRKDKHCNSEDGVDWEALMLLFYYYLVIVVLDFYENLELFF